MSRTHTHIHPLHGRALGAVIGTIVCLACALIIHALVSGDQTGLFAFPATIVTAIFVGIVAGMMFASIIIGGRADDRATEAAHKARNHPPPKFDRDAPVARADSHKKPFNMKSRGGSDG